MSDIDPAFAPLVEAFAGDREVTGGTMMASFGLKVKGKIFAMHVRGQLVVKLPRYRVDELVSGGKGERFDPRRDGRVMKEWLVAASSRTAEWIALAKEAYKFVKAGGAAGRGPTTPASRRAPAATPKSSAPPRKRR